MIHNTRRTEITLLILGLLFGWLVAASLWLQSHASMTLIVLTTCTLTGICVHLWLNRVAPQRDPLLLPIALTLTTWGLLNIARVAPNFLERQLVWLVVGLLALCGVAASRDRLRWLRRFKYTWLIASLALLAATLLLGVNPAGEGARRWLSVAGIFLQPSEVLRLLMISFLAAFYSERTGLNRMGTQPFTRSDHLPSWNPLSNLQTRFKSLSPLAPSFVMWLFALGLQATQQDIGASALLLISYAFMLYLATGEPSLPLIGLVMLASAIAIGYFFSSLIALRVNIWLNPWLDPQGSAFQIVQSLIAVASGGVIGQGPGQGRPIYVPAVHTDFPYAAISEEYGYVGALVLLVLFGLLLLRAWRIMHGTHSAYTLLLAGGVGILVTTQLFVIVGGNLGLIPLTGVTVPFVSYGGSSLLVSFISVGLLIRLSCDYAPEHYNEPRLPQNLSAKTTSGSDLVLKVTLKQRIASRNTIGITIALIAVLAVASGYWSVLHGVALTSRDDNPRHVDDERAIDRGPIVARDGTLLAYSQLQTQATDYSPPVYARHYPVASAAPIIGYDSLWHGVGGIEAYADAQLRGLANPMDNLLHLTQLGMAYTTTLDVPMQSYVAAVMSGTIGSAIVMDYHTGEVLVLTSAPSYDPATLDANWDTLRSMSDAPLLNRATQGLYQPGALLAWLYANEHGIKQTTSLEVLKWDPNDRFELGKSVAFELDNASVTYPATGTYSETIGQGTLRVTPLRIAVTAAWLAAGQPVVPRITFAESTTHIPARPSEIRAEYTGLAQSSTGKYVGWYVGIDDQVVTVLTLESQTDSASLLNDMVARLKKVE
jgi:cell division protein FtsW (lipid II flippase)